MCATSGSERIAVRQKDKLTTASHSRTQNLHTDRLPGSCPATQRRSQLPSGLSAFGRC